MDIRQELLNRAEDADRIIYALLPAEEGYQKTVLEAMNYSVRSGGKRLRPVLMHETYRMFGGTDPAISYFMAAIEMIHSYSLVHDDLPAMDGDTLRRGKPTTWSKYGEDIGVLAGDGLLNYAFETALKAFDEDIDQAKAIQALRILGSKAGVYGMIGGQTVDVESSKALGVDKKRLDFIYELKTGALLEAAMKIGAVLAGASDSECLVIEEAAAKTGLAFQIRDDILDVTGDTNVIGKPVGSDERNHKVTYVTFAGLKQAEADVECLSEQAVKLLDGLGREDTFLRELILYLAHRDK